MKFGVCKDIKKLAEFNSDIVDYCEMPLSAISKMTDEEISERIEIINKTGIPVTCVNGFFPKDMPLCGPDMNEEEVTKYTENALKKVSDDIYKFAMAEGLEAHAKSAVSRFEEGM